MKRACWLGVITALCLPLGLQAGTLYLCRAYSGGSFWASTHCHQHKALLERLVSVPDGMPFDQQVALGQQQRVEAARLNGASLSSKKTTAQPSANAKRLAQCKALEDKITQYVSKARQAQSGPAQDRLSAQKRAARDRQFELKC